MVEKVGLRTVKKFGVGSTDTFDEVLYYAKQPNSKDAVVLYRHNANYSGPYPFLSLFFNLKR